MKKTILLAAIAALVTIPSPSPAAFVDYGLTLGTFNNEGSVVASGSGLFELGVFSGYTDSLGASYFTGKDYSNLRSSWSSFAGSSSAIDASGGFYVTVDLVSTVANTRLFAWGFSTPTASEAANWTIISGEIGGTSAYAPVWLAVAPADITVNAIELGTTHNVMYANSNPGNAFQPNTVAPSELSANISVVPEPSTYALLSLAGLALGGYAARRRLRA
jgi:hypothetical protein